MQKHLASIVLFTLTATLFAQENDAEKMFRAMESKVRAVKSLKMVCELEGTISDEDDRIKVKASQQFAGKNKARFELHTEMLGIISKTLQLCDGKQMVAFESGRAVGEPRPADPELNAGLPKAIGRGGFMLPRLVVNRDKTGFDADKLLPASNFKLGAKERVGDKDAQIIEYIVKFGGESSAFGNCDKVEVTLWIDAKTMIPLKRKVASANAKKRFFVEVYKEFVINPELDSKIFSLPK
jgi:outer membrane lipoprotein-sorting protein